MSSHQDSYYYPDSGPVYHESGSNSPDVQQPRPMESSWLPTTTTGDQSGYSQPPQTLDLVGNSLEAYDAEDKSNPFNFPDPTYSLPSTSSQQTGVETDATYTNDDIPSQQVANFPFYPYHGPGYDFPQNQHDYAPYDPTLAHTSLYYVPQHPVQDIHTPQASQALPATGYPYSSPALLQASHSGPMYRTDAGAATSPTPVALTLEVANTAGAGQHSHQSPVATSSANQSASPGSSRTFPSSPERKRPLQLSAADDLSTARRVLPRRDRASSVHSASPHSPTRSRSSSTVQGRGPLIPQERYTTNTISSHNASNQYLVIAFNVENPDQFGIPIIDILNKTDGYTRIHGRTDSFNMDKKTFTLRIRWPGYAPWAKTIAAMNWKKTRGPTTRVKLAEAVATAVRDLFEGYHDAQCDSEYEMWNVGPNGIQLDQVCLVALHQVSKGSWQPQLCLLSPPH